jgi:hypothetical protein
MIDEETGTEVRFSIGLHEGSFMKTVVLTGWTDPGSDTGASKGNFQHPIEGKWSLTHESRAQKIPAAGIDAADPNDSLSAADGPALKKMRQTLGILTKKPLTGGRYKGHESGKQDAQDTLRDVPQLLERMNVREKLNDFFGKTEQEMRKVRESEKVKVENAGEEVDLKSEAEEKMMVKVESE